MTAKTPYSQLPAKEIRRLRYYRQYWRVYWQRRTGPIAEWMRASL